VTVYNISFLLTQSYNWGLVNRHYIKETHIFIGDILPMTATKATIEDEVQNQLNISKNRSVELVETLLEIIKKTLESGDDVMVSGFGKFSVKEKKTRKGRNPATGEKLMLEARKVVTFKCAGGLRDKVNGE